MRASTVSVAAMMAPERGWPSIAASSPEELAVADVAQDHGAEAR